MVKFQLMSDIHIEQCIENKIESSEYVIPTSPILILAGDIGRIHRFEQLSYFLTDVCSKFKIVIYVLGNHEYYRVDGYPELKMEENFKRLKNLNIKNLYILNRSAIVIENVCVIGCTLWSKTQLYDLPKFIVRISELNVASYNNLHEKDLNYIKRMITWCKERDKKLLVITHHPPSYSLLQSRKENKYKSLYATNLDNMLVKEDIDTWVCGHVHRNFDITFPKGTRVISNQLGKKYDNITNFSKEFVFSVK